MRLLPILVVLASAVAFLPSLNAGWVGWDDPVHFLNNPWYRGLGATQLRWMFEGPHFGQYFPFSWITLGFDYVIWGMAASGYHLTNLLLHAASAGILYAVGLRLFAAAAPRARDDERRYAATAAALAFSLHPLRVESVAWITERRDVLSGFFYLLAVLFYLRSCAEKSSRWRAAALVAYAASLLSKAAGMTLPAALIILDIFPLKRLPSDVRRWTGARERAVLLEKLPFALLSLAALLAAWGGLRVGGTLVGVGAFGFTPRVAEAAYGFVFYLWKTIWPFGLIPLYEEPLLVRLAEPRFAACLAATLAVAAGAWAARKRFPAIPAATLFYALTLAPLSGLVRNGIPHLTQDRYSYLPSLGLSLLVGGAALFGLARRRGPTLIAASLLLAAWGGLSWRQTGFWHDSLSLWGRTLAVRPDHEVGHKNMAAALGELGDFSGAEVHARRAVELRPSDFEAWDDLGAAQMRLGRTPEAEASFARSVALQSDYAPSLRHWGDALAARGAFADAIERYRGSLRLNEFDATTRFALGNVLVAAGRTSEAAAEYERVLDLDPALAPARLNLGLLLAGSGRPDAAATQYRLALRSKTEAAAANFDWGNLLSDQGRLESAVGRYREALRLDPGFLGARFNLGNVLARLGRYPEAASEYRGVLARRPGDARAEENLRLVSAFRRR